MKNNSTLYSFFYISFYFYFIDDKRLCEKEVASEVVDWTSFVSCVLSIVPLQQIPPFPMFPVSSH